MKKVRIEDSPSFQLFVEETPSQTDKSINVFGTEQFNFLVKGWGSQHDRFILTIDEGGGAISLMIVRSKIGNGYVKRQLESGQHTVGRIFDIVSPVYYIEEPERGTASDSRMITTFNKNVPDQPNKCMFFPNPVEQMQVLFNNYPIGTAHSDSYGKGFGLAGKSFFYQTMSFEPDPEIDVINQMYIQNKVNSTDSTRVPYIAGEYKLL